MPCLYHLRLIAFLLGLCSFGHSRTQACSVLYYVDTTSGKVYVVNNEDYWYDVKAYIRIEPASKSGLARLWYGWDAFAQGGINEAGLFFDAAVTPEQERIPGYRGPKGNLGDEILAKCSTVEEALTYLELKRVALHNSHMMFGDKSGKAVIVEWVGGERKLHWMEGNRLIMTNYLLSDTAAGNHPCYRHASIDRRLNELERSGEPIDLLRVGNTFGQAGQAPRAVEGERIGGTVYTSFINVTDMAFVLSYKMSNQHVVQLDLKAEFAKGRRQKIAMKD